MKISVFYDHIEEASRQTGLPVSEILKRCREAGVEGVEIRDICLKARETEIRRELEAASIEAVSYTHLDVYKRQEFTFDTKRNPYLTAELGGGLQVTAHRRTYPWPEDIEAQALCYLGGGANLLGYYMSVSYTHLDVYKRQVSIWLKLRFLSLFPRNRRLRPLRTTL